MKITPTHKSTLNVSGKKVCAHQFGSGPDPEWVKAHFTTFGLGDDHWSGKTNAMVEAHGTDWAVAMKNRTIVVLSNAEFLSLFVPLNQTYQI